MKYGLKYKIFKWIFKSEMEELNNQIYYLITELNYQAERNSNLEKVICEHNKKLKDNEMEIIVLIKELQKTKDEIEIREKIIDNLCKENKIMTLILQTLNLYKK